MKKVLIEIDIPNHMLAEFTADELVKAMLSRFGDMPAYRIIEPSRPVEPSARGRDEKKWTDATAIVELTCRKCGHIQSGDVIPHTAKACHKCGSTWFNSKEQSIQFICQPHHGVFCNYVDQLREQVSELATLCKQNASLQSRLDVMQQDRNDWRARAEHFVNLAAVATKSLDMMRPFQVKGAD